MVPWENRNMTGGRKQPWVHPSRGHVYWDECYPLKKSQGDVKRRASSSWHEVAHQWGALVSIYVGTLSGGTFLCVSLKTSAQWLKATIIDSFSRVWFCWGTSVSLFLWEKTNLSPASPFPVLFCSSSANPLLVKASHLGSCTPGVEILTSIAGVVGEVDVFEQVISPQFLQDLAWVCRATTRAVGLGRCIRDWLLFQWANTRVKQNTTKLLEEKRGEKREIWNYLELSLFWSDNTNTWLGFSVSFSAFSTFSIMDI